MVQWGRPGAVMAGIGIFFVVVGVCNIGIGIAVSKPTQIGIGVVVLVIALFLVLAGYKSYQRSQAITHARAHTAGSAAYPRQQLTRVVVPQPAVQPVVAVPVAYPAQQPPAAAAAAAAYPVQQPHGNAAFPPAYPPPPVAPGSGHAPSAPPQPSTALVVGPSAPGVPNEVEMSAQQDNARFGPNTHGASAPYPDIDLPSYEDATR